jgi:hypothetical protein
LASTAGVENQIVEILGGIAPALTRDTFQAALVVALIAAIAGCVHSQLVDLKKNILFVFFNNCFINHAFLIHIRQTKSVV